MKITDDMLTEWFPGDVKPVHKGPYLTESESGKKWVSHWNGRRWGWGVEPSAFFGGRARPNSATCRKAPGYQHRSWKGLKEKHHG